jgi:hypothetical protein
MADADESTQLILEIDIEEGDRDDVDRACRQLLTEVRDLEVESVDLVRGEAAPEGAKVAGAVTIGALAIAVLPTVLPRLVDFLQHWSLRGGDRKLRLKAKVEGRELEVEFAPDQISPDEVEQWITKVTAGMAGKA